MKQAEAHRALVGFIGRCAADSHKAVLVITGKGTARGTNDGIMPSERRGVLKAQVPLWLEEPGLREHVIGLRAAGPRHGGAGALYVLLRRKKPGR
jgi:DNA-nicking Smr family endonuclease